MIARRALFLDKDGVINVDHGYVCSPGRTDFIEGIFQLCRTATRQGFLNVVVTNQAGIARGYYSETTFLTYMRWMREQFALQGCSMDAVYYCPHHPGAGLGNYRRICKCRKPEPGMFLRAAKEWHIDLSTSVMVGDKCSDIVAAHEAGVVSAWRFSPGVVMDERDHIVGKLVDVIGQL